MTTELVELAERMDRQARMDRRDGDEFAANRVEAFANELRALASRAGGPDGFVLVPREPTEQMVVDGFESWPDAFFSTPEEWGAYEAMSGCQQAAHRARLCYAAMLAAAPEPVGVG